MKLSQWAKQQGISYQTAWRWFKAGTLPVPVIQSQTGTIIVQPKHDIKPINNNAWIYARVSSPNKKDDLERQAQRCIEFCSKSGWPVIKVIKEIASGMNDSRPKLLKLLSENPTRLVVEHKDRLTRFGFRYFEELLPKVNCELVVINRDFVEKDDLLKDFAAIVTSFCCRLYGLRRGQNKARKIKEELK